MATLKISQDKENQLQFRRKQETMASQKRSVLGILDGNKASEKFDKAVKKPVFGVRHDLLSNSYNHQPSHQQKHRSNLNVPVAQFEAFKVYEDSPEPTLNHEPEIEQMEVAEEIETVLEVDEEVSEEVHLVTEADRVETETRKSTISDLAVPNGSLCETIPFSEHSFCSIGRIKELESEEYQIDIYKYMRQIEVTNRPKAGYMKKQPDISHNMRTILVDWLVEVAEEYKLHTETLYLAINFVDRFLSYMSVVRAKLQLVGTAAMYIAAKYEEIIPPDVSEFVYITDDTYSRRQVIRMEHLILKVLQFDLSTPTPFSFINAMTTINKEVTPRVVHLAMYISELGLLEAEPFLEFLPSVLAASAIALAQHTLALDVWPQSFVESTGFKLHHLKRCIIFLDLMFKKAPNMSQKAIQEKYKSQKHYHVSKILPREENIIFPEREDN